ncbi:hypothetical protein [Jongsikchunia kroppenstedtii]|uniref:hypothetical protein n=1 Tax=Jongsikchunia kroppenstedtii TaxID=1121721 RepID=UPI001FDFBAE2|nr:hypothetical protein [Jongsikchunia kroppenstedtii]
MADDDAAAEDVTEEVEEELLLELSSLQAARGIRTAAAAAMAEMTLFVVIRPGLPQRMGRGWRLGHYRSLWSLGDSNS